MALKDTWVNKVDNVDDVLAKDINDIADSVIELEKQMEQQKESMEPLEKEVAEINEDLSYLGNLKNSEGEGSVAQVNGGVTNSSGSQTEASVAKGKSAVAFGARGIAKGDATFTAGYKSRAYQVGSAGFGSSTAGYESKQNVFDEMLALATSEADLYANYETYKAQYNETHPSNPLTLDLAGFKEAKYSFSFAACEDNKALARSSAVFGRANTAKETARGAFVAGENNVVTGEYQTVVGRYSEGDSNKPFIIGGGSSASTRKNIVAVDRQGTIGAKNIDDYVYTFETTRKVEQNVSASYADISSENGVLKIVSTSLANCPEITDTDLQTDPQIFHRFPIPFKGSVYQYVKIKYKAEKAENLNPRIHFITKGKAEVYENWVGTLFSDEKIVVEMTTDDDGWTTAILNMSNYEEWSNDFIATIRLDITNDKYVGDVAYIQYFGVFKSLAEAERYEPIDTKIDKKAEKNDVANALKGTASSSVIKVDDVSPVSHDVSVKVRSKNLCQITNYETNNEIVAIKVFKGNLTEPAVFQYKWSGTPDTENRALFQYFFADGTSGYIGSGGNIPDTKKEFYFSSVTEENPIVEIRLINWQKLSVFYDMKLELGSTATEWTPYVDVSETTLTRVGKNLLPFDKPLSLVGNENYLFECNIPAPFTITITANIETIATTPSSTFLQLVYADGEVTNFTPNALGFFVIGDIKKSISVNNGKILKKVHLYNWCHVTGTANEMQIELGDSATEYEPFKQQTEYTPNADGTVEGVTSIYPNMTLFTDTSNAVIDVEYNKDINKVFAELQNAIISLGGNV